ncbi:DUF4097 family beta strand repeat-containing protein [[Clostridium] fimetarium]|uniref:Putative adhesin n=1 Tax=[Clostridium] fimetarium TaxID=99656 RepID=A0A1I0PY39_9FIRM|nr:DUF4097 family beta strand repeat-containing protein [[Clostridium] fimetarium]SEW19476.1 Putative adhesin [[Clostridium] fimetarium]
MNKLTKNALRMAAIFIPIGILLIIVGVFTGAKRGVYIESGRINLNGDKDYNNENYDITDIKNIIVDVSNAKIVIKESTTDKFGFDVNLTSIAEDPTVSFDNNMIKIEKNAKFGFNIFSWDFGSLFDGTSNEVIIFVPKGTILNEVTLNTDNGRIEITNLNADTLKADTSNGAITTTNVVISNNTSLKTSNGEVDISGTFSNTTYAKSSNGKIIGDGLFNGKTTVKTSNGAISFKNNIKRSDCNIAAETSNGSVRINDSKVGDEFKENNGANNSIDLDTSNGGITIELE